MKKIIVATAVLATLALTGCAGSNTEVSQGTPKPDENCLPVDDSMLEAIAEGNSGAPLTAGEGAAAKDGELYVIAMKFDDGQGEMTGLWASGSLTAGESVIGSVDGFAKQFTQWPDASGSPWQASSADDVSVAAKKCLG